MKSTHFASIHKWQPQTSNCNNQRHLPTAPKEALDVVIDCSSTALPGRKAYATQNMVVFVAA